MHVAWRNTLPSKFSVQESYATPIPMYNLGDDNKIHSKIMLFTILCKVRWFPGICQCRWHKFHHKSLKFNWDFRILKLFILLRLHRKLIELINTILKARMLASCGLRWWRKPKFRRKLPTSGDHYPATYRHWYSIPGTPVFDPGPQWWQVRVLPLALIQVPQFVWFKSLEYVRNISQWKTYLVHVDEMFCVHKI